MGVLLFVIFTIIISEALFLFFHLSMCVSNLVIEEKIGATEMDLHKYKSKLCNTIAVDALA